MNDQAAIQENDLNEDVYFLDIEDAYRQAVKQQRKVDDNGMERLINCYYDGPLTDITLENFIQIPSDSFVEKLAATCLPIPKKIAIPKDGVVYFSDMPVDVVEEINIKRRERADIIKKIKKLLRDLIDKKLSDLLDRDTYFVDPLLVLNEAPQKKATPRDGVVYFNDMPADAIEEMNIKRRKRTDKKIKKLLNDQNLSDFLERDTYFIDPLLALNEAKQKNRVDCGHPTIDGLQVCYYRGELPVHGIENLIHVELPDFVDFFIVSRSRLPELIKMPDELEDELKETVRADFEHLVSLVKKNRLELAQQLAVNAKSLRPAVDSDKLLRVFVPASRLTTVMQYGSYNVAKAFEKQGYDILFYIEENDMMDFNVVDYISRYIEFNPHIVFNINHLNNDFLHEDVVNIIWWQDPMPLIRQHQPLAWREKDFNFSISPFLDTHLMLCGARDVVRQHFVVDDDIFNIDNVVDRQEKIVFIGSSYLPFVNDKDDEQSRIIKKFVDIINSGGEFDENSILEISSNSCLDYDFIFWKIFAYVIRDYSVKWLCAAPNMPVEIYGRFWEKTEDVSRYFMGEFVHGADVASVYKSAEYALVSHPFEINSQRLAEIIACGCIPVVYDCRKIAEKPHWDDYCLFFKNEDELKSIIDNRKVPKKNPHDLANSFTYKGAVESFIAKSNILG